MLMSAAFGSDALPLLEIALQSLILGENSVDM